MPLPYYRVQWMPGAGPFDIPGDFYLLLPAGAGFASTPDHADFAVTDLHFRCEVTLDALPTVTATLAQQYDAATNQRGWLFGVNTQGKLFAQWSTDGTSGTLTSRTAAFPLPSLGRIAIGVKLDVNNGAGGNTIIFEIADALGGSWSDLASEIAAGTTSIHNSNQSLLLRSAAPYTVRHHKAELRASIGGAIVANPNPSIQAAGATSFNDTAPTPKPWTVTGSATITGFDWVTEPKERVQSIDMNEGRDNELDQFRAATCTIVLRNNDRRYDPEHTTGPYFGKLLPRAPFRVQLSTDNVTWVDQFYGSVKGGWPPTYMKPAVSTTTVELEDLLGVLESEELPPSVYEAEVLADHPEAYWRLNERSGAQMADSSGNGRHGFIDNGVLGSDSLVAGSDAGLEVAHVGDNRGRFKGEGLPIGPPCTLVAWVKTPRDLAAVKSIIVVQRDSALGSAVWLQIQTSAGGSPNGELVINFAGLGTFYRARGSARIDDDEPHMVACTIAGSTAADVKLYVDGVEQTKTTISGTNPGTWPSHLIWTVGNTVDTTSGDWGLDGIIDEVSIYDVALDADRVAQLYEAGSTAFGGEMTGARIERVLDQLGVPPSFRDIATGDSTVGPVEYASRSAADYVQRIVESEQGALYVNHRAGGKITFRGRYDRLTATRSTTTQATFKPEHYRTDIEPEPNAVRTIVNTVDVSWQGGTETVVDETSRKRYGAQKRSIGTEAATPQVARSAGGWLTTRYANPQVRVRRLPFDLAGKPALWAKILDLRISDRVVVERHPQKVGAQISNDVIVEGRRLVLNRDKSWTVEYQLSSADDTQVWIWGTSTWGETTTWG